VTDPVDPIRRLDRLSRVGRGAAGAARAGKAPEPPSSNRAVVPVGPARTHDPESARVPVDSAFAAHLLAGAPRRGLKGGPETLEQARTTYLQNEYSGPADRRAKKGRETKTEI
jgi:hypothetical protein